MAYEPIEFGGEDYFKKAFEIVNEEIDRAVKKSAKAFAQKAVTSFGQMPYGSSATQSIIGDIFSGGEKAKGRAYTDIGLGAAIPQFQAQFQASESEKQRTWGSSEAELDRILKREVTQLMYDMGITQAEASKMGWFQSLMGGAATGIGYGLGGPIGELFGGGLGSLTTPKPKEDLWGTAEYWKL